MRCNIAAFFSSRTLGVLSVSVLAGTAVAAQNAPQSRCDDAAFAVSEHAIPATGTAAWNHWQALTSCGTRGATIVAGVLTSPAVRGETDPARLNALAGMLDGWFSAPLVQAYETLTESPDASPAVRLRAMWLLAGLFNPNVDVAGPLQRYAANGCTVYSRTTLLRDQPVELPQSAIDDARYSYQRAAGDGGAPESVRATARCWDSIIGTRVIAQNQQQQQMDPQMPQQQQMPIPVTTQDPNDPSVVAQPQQAPGSTTTVVIQQPVRIIYDCDDRFTVWNDASYDLSVGFGFGVSRAGSFRVGRGRSYSFVASRVGPVRFWVGDRQVGFFNYVRRPCGYHGPVYFVPPFYRYPLFYSSPAYYPRRPVITPFRSGAPREVVPIHSAVPRAVAHEVSGRPAATPSAHSSSHSPGGGSRR